MIEYFNQVAVDLGSNSFHIHSFMDGRKTNILFLRLIA